MIYDLSDPVIGDSLRVTDIMKTMDNRIAIDEEALEHFVADQYIRETADRFRQKKLAIAQRKQKAAQKKSMDDLLDNARVLTPPPIAPVPEEDASRSGKRPQACETGLIFYVQGGNGVSFRMQLEMPDLAVRMLHTGLHPELISSPCIYIAVILLPHKDCFPPSDAPDAEYSGNAP